MNPKTSNTRSSLLNLAVEFGSKTNGYEDFDDKCLNVILSFFKEYIEKDFKCLGAPLIQSIRFKNNDAIKILIGAKANFFSPLQEDENDITDIYKFSETPLMILFKLNNDKGQLTELFNGILKDQKEEILQRAIYTLKVNGQTFPDYLEDIKLLEVKSFLNDQKIIVKPPITPILDLSPKSEPNPEPEQKPEPKPEPKKCAQNNSHQGPFTICHNCNKFFCLNCFDDHQCK